MRRFAPGAVTPEFGYPRVVAGPPRTDLPMARFGLHALLSLLVVSCTCGLVGAVPASASQVGAPTIETVTHIAVDGDGGAVVTVEIRTPLTDDASAAAFADLRERIAANRSDELAAFTRSAEGLLARAATATGRRMTASDFAVETETVDLPRRWGVVRYTFRWSNFAVADGDALRVEGVLSGYLLAAGDTLIVSGPADHGPRTVAPVPEESSGSRVVWVGPEEFGATEPHVTFAPGPDGVDDVGASGFLTPPVAAAGALLLFTAGGAYWLRRRGRTAGGDQPAASALDPDISDRERLVSAIRDAGGRVRQQELVSQTGWSETKVSKVSSDLEGAGAIRKLRIGRENVIRLVDETALADGRSDGDDPTEEKR